jgi:polar amino acid transport system substrate-binding protein
MAVYRPMRRLLALAISLICVGCASPPIDPEATLQRVRGGTIRAGITDNPPWTIVREVEMSGVEVDLLEGLAEDTDADIEWVDGSEEELLGALELGQLDVVVGGLSAENTWSKHAAFTHPYHTSQTLIAVPVDQEIPDDISGMRVAVEANTEAAGLLEKTDAVVELVDDITQVEGPVLVDDWLLDDLDLRETGVVLSETDHVMAVRLGENGWMVTLEKYLLDRAGDIPNLLDEAES